MRANGRGYQSGIVQSLLNTQNNSISNLRISYHEMGVRAFLRALTRGGIILKYIETRSREKTYGRTYKSGVKLSKYTYYDMYFRITNLVYGNLIYPITDDYLNVEIIIAKNWVLLNIGKTNYLHNPLKKMWIRETLPKKKLQYKLQMIVDRRPKFKKFGAYTAKQIKTAVREQAVHFVPNIMES